MSSRSGHLPPGRSPKTTLNHGEAFEVKRLSLFGSTARDEAGPDSDIDILVEFKRPVGLFHLFSLQNRLEEILGHPVDLGTPDSLKERVKASVIKDAVDVPWKPATQN